MLVHMFAGYGKKKNSTARPELADGTTFNVTLKEETNLLYPDLLFNTASPGFPSPFTPAYFTYAYIATFQRYYYVKNWEYLNGIWKCSLTVDVLASFKTAIGSMSAYVERSASASNGNLIDTLYPARADVNVVEMALSCEYYNVNPSEGCYIIGIINYLNRNKIGAISYYALNNTRLGELLAYLFSNNIYQASSITEIGEGLYKSLFDPFQYIVSCLWLANDPIDFGTDISTIKVGYWDTGVSAVEVSKVAIKTTIKTTTAISDHPQISRGAYLNYAPYTKITLYCPPFGEIPVDPVYMQAGKYLIARCFIDPISGQSTLRVGFYNTASIPDTTDPVPCIEKNALLGVPIQLAQVLSDYSSSIQTLTSSFSSGGILSGISKIIGATVGSALASQFPQVSTQGTNGSFIAFQMKHRLIIERALLAAEDNTDLGRPLMETRTLNTLSGYIKCAEAHFNGACLDAEKDLVNSFLVNGFYYE